MAIHYKRYELQLYEYLGRLERLLQKTNCFSFFPEVEEEIIHLKKTIEDRKFRVAVVGEFKRGKSTFVNALLGKEILPADCLPTTAVMSRITYNDSPVAYLIMKDGTQRSVKISELVTYITKLTENYSENAEKISEAVVEYPSMFCQNGVDLIDTPGLNDTEALDLLTINGLTEIDLAIMVIDVLSPFSMTEASLVVSMLENPQIEQILFVVTKTDTIRRESDKEKILSYVKTRIRDMVKEQLNLKYSEESSILEKYQLVFDHMHFFAVSSLDALTAIEENDAELFEKSGFKKLNKELPEIILSNQNNNIIRKTMIGIENIVALFEADEAGAFPILTPKIQEYAQIKNQFAQLAYYCTKDLFSISNVLWSELTKETSETKNNFIKALTQMQQLEYSELLRVWDPIVPEEFRRLNKVLQTKEEAYIRLWKDTTFLPLLEETVLQLCKLAQQVELEDALIVEIQKLSNCFKSLDELFVRNTQFYWNIYPIPAQQNIPQNWNITPLMQYAIDQSMKQYLEDRQAELNKKLGVLQENLDKQIQKLVMTFFGWVNQKRNIYQKQLNNLSDPQYLTELNKIKEHTYTLFNEFSKEIKERE